MSNKQIAKILKDNKKLKKQNNKLNKTLKTFGLILNRMEADYWRNEARVNPESINVLVNGVGQYRDGYIIRSRPLPTTLSREQKEMVMDLANKSVVQNSHPNGELMQ